MNEIIKSGVLGVITIIMLFVGAYFTNETKESDFQSDVNIEKKEVKVQAVAETVTLETKNIKNNSEAIF